jgi:hypothetical protein
MDKLHPVHGEIVKCDMCGREYKFFVWAMGNDTLLCRSCCVSRPQSALNHIDDMEIEDPYVKDYEEGNTDWLEAVNKSKTQMMLSHPHHHLTKGTRS